MDALLHIARMAARTSCEVIRPYYGKVLTEFKDDLSPITEADRAANRVLIEHLLGTGFPILSEESDGIPLPYPEKLWVIDPLDGTKGFINETDDFSVMVALLEAGRPTLAVVDAPMLDKCYFAVRGGGAFIEDGHGVRPLKVSNRTTPSLRGVMSVNHAAPYMHGVCEALEVEEIISIGSVGIKAGYISEDIGDFFLTLGALGEWDVCAPELILTEAGGKVTDREGAPIAYGNSSHRIQRGVVFSNSVSHDQIITALARIL